MATDEIKLILSIDSAELRDAISLLLPPEKIVSAAILAGGAISSLPPPARHHDLIRKWDESGATGGGISINPEKQGFLTSEGRFVSRKEAMDIAVAAGQLEEGKYHKEDLFSEDLW